MQRFIPTSTTFDSDSIEGILKNWALKPGKLLSICNAFNQKGGWEGWAQVEIANELSDFMDQLRGYGLDIAAVIQREASVYAENQYLEADIVVHTYYQAPKHVQRLICSQNMDTSDMLDNLPRRSFVIELKCESAKNSGKFRSNVMEDLQKIQKGIHIRGVGQSTWVVKLAMAISVSPEGFEVMEGIETEFSSTIATKSLYLGRTELDYTVYLWIFRWKSFEDDDDDDDDYDDYDKDKLIDIDIENEPYKSFIRSTTEEWTISYISRLPYALQAHKRNLKKYYAWHYLGLSLEEIVNLDSIVPATLHREDPVQWSNYMRASASASANDIMVSVRLEELPFDRSKMKELISVNSELDHYRDVFDIHD